MIALENPGEMQSSRMCHPQRDKGHQRSDRGGSDAVPQHAHPGVDLPDLLPPVVLDDEIGGGGADP